MSPTVLPAPALRCPRCGSDGDVIAGGLCGGCLADTAFHLHEDADLTEDARPPAPSTLGGYELHEELGRGGMGVVYRARQCDLDRVVALKVIPAGPLADPEFLARFRAEARLAGRLRHPHIVAVHDVGEADGHAFFSMDLVPGPTLARRVREHGPLPPRRAAALAAKIADALHHAHLAGVLHRDVKPSNILLDADDEPHIADFGLAKAPGDPALTLTNQTMGTPAWLAPEQAAGNAAGTSERTDVYGLGAVLYFALTGRAPFPGHTVAELLHQVQNQEPAPPRLLDPGIPRDLETITLRCLEKNPARRYASAAATAEELGRYLAGEPILARPAGPLARAWRWAQRRRALAAALAALLLVIGGAAVAVTLLWLRASHAAVSEKEQRQVAQAELWNSLLQTARGQRRSGASDARGQVLATVRRAAALQVTPAVRDEAIAALAMPEIRFVRQALHLGATQHPDYPVALHPLLPLACMMQPDDSLHLLSLTDGHTVRGFTKQSLTGQGDLLFSTGGRYLSRLDRAGRLNLWQTETGQAQPLTPWSDRPCYGVLTTADEATLMLCHEKSVDFFTMPAGRFVRTLPLEQEWRQMALSPSGQFLALALESPAPAAGLEKSGTVQLLTTDNGRSLADFSTPQSITTLEWSADEHLLACALERGDILLFDTLHRKLLTTLRGHDSRATELRFLPGSRFLLTTSWDRTTRLWDVLRGELLLTHPSSGATLALCGPDRTGFMQELNGEVAEHRIILPRTARELLPPPAAGSLAAGTTSTAFSADGRVLFTGGYTHLRAWDTASGAFLAETPGGISVLPLPDHSGVLASTALGLFRYSFTDGKFGPAEPWGPRARCNYAALTPDGSTAVVSLDPLTETRGACTTVEVWQRGQRLASWNSGAFYPPLAISDDGKLIATGGHQRCKLGLWSAADGAVLPLDAAREDLFADFGIGVALDPAGRQLVSVSSTHIRIWDLPTRRLRFRLPRPGPGSILAAAISPDGNLLATGGAHHELWLLDLHTGQRLAVLEVPHSRLPFALAFSPDGRHLAAALAGNGVLLWDVCAMRKELRELGLDW